MRPGPGMPRARSRRRAVSLHALERLLALACFAGLVAFLTLWVQP